MKKGKPLTVRVETASEPIDLTAWARNYVREVLRIEGYTVSSTPASSDSPPFVYPELPPSAVKVRHRTVDSATRNRILERDGEVCNVCDDLSGPFEIDHKLPVSRGGTHDDENLWVLCRACNALKGDLTVAEFVEAFGVLI